MIDLVVHASTPAPAGLSAVWPQVRAIPSDLRSPVEMIVLVFVVGRLVPWLAGPVCAAAAAALTAARAVILLAEYAFTSQLRRRRLPVPAAVYAVDDGVDMVVQGGQAAVRRVGRALGRRWRLRLILLVLLPVVALFSRPALASSVDARPYVGTIDDVLTAWRPVDGWVVTGRWNGVPPAPPACGAARR